MYRAALRSTSRAALRPPPGALLRAAPRRFASTQSPADKPRSWKSSALRWGLAAAAVYYYSTGSVFADEASEPQSLIPAPSSFAESDLPTVDAVIEEKRKQSTPAGETAESNPAAASQPGKQPRSQAQTSTPSSEALEEESPEALEEESPEALEEEAGQEGAFNPETGEINWDCPCLGGMAHGPCGDDFKSAFSCFVHSTEEPKGMDCIDKFQGMQECFRKYPDIYGAELADDEASQEAEDGAQQPPAPENQAASQAETRQETRAPRDEEQPKQPHDTDVQALRDEVAVIKAEAPNFPSAKSTEGTAPARWADATDANEEVEKAGQKDAEKEASPAKASK